MFVIKGKKTFARVFIDEIDQTTRDQITAIVDHPALTNPISIMPDCHAGKGCVIGFTMTASDCIIPNLIGVDVGCGVCSVHIKNIKSENVNFKHFDEIVKQHIPAGMNSRRDNALEQNLYAGLFPNLADVIKDVSVKIDKSNRTEYFINSVGTLGGGNHYIEVGYDTKNPEYGIYISVHTGSRNFGLSIANYFQKKAKDLCQAMRVDVPSGTEYLPLMYGGHEYLDCMRIAQEYAKANRYVILYEIMSHMWPGITLEWKMIESVHNYISPRGNIIRKGAIAAYIGEEVIIPLNMRDGALIGIGKSNKEWNYSAPHGAGRKMSRTEAKKTLNMEEFTNSMKGIYSSTICKGTLDEAPGAYKDAQMIIDSISDTVTVTKRLLPLYNFKSTEEED